MKKIFLLLGVILVIILIAIIVLSIEVKEKEEANIIVESLKVNGLEESSLTLTMDDESVISAVFYNKSDIEGEITLSVRKNDQLFDNRHDWTYKIGPGEIKEVEEVRETHRTWYPGEFTVKAGDKVIEVIVQE